jgi:multiple RNA-binding domain-containing protein 1
LLTNLLSRFLNLHRYAKGLSFATSEAGLRAHFLRAASAAGGRVLSATVATQKGPGGATLSRGFGFVEFDSPATVGLDTF